VYKTVTLRGTTLNSTTVPQIKGMVFAESGAKTYLQSNDINNLPNTVNSYFIQQTDPNFGAFGSVAVNYIVRNRKYNLDFDSNTVIDGITRSIYTTLSQDYLNPGRNVMFCDPSNGKNWITNVVYQWETIPSRELVYVNYSFNGDTSFNITSRYLTPVKGPYNVMIRIIGIGGSGENKVPDGYKFKVRLFAGSGGGPGGFSVGLTNGRQFYMQWNWYQFKDNCMSYASNLQIKDTGQEIYAGKGSERINLSQTTFNQSNGGASYSPCGFSQPGFPRSDGNVYIYTTTWDSNDRIPSGSSSHNTTISTSNYDNSGYFPNYGMWGGDTLYIYQLPLFTATTDVRSYSYGAAGSGSSLSSWSSAFFEAHGVYEDYSKYARVNEPYKSRSRFVPYTGKEDFITRSGQGGTLTGNVNNKNNRKAGSGGGGESNGWWADLSRYDYYPALAATFGCGGAGSGTNGLDIFNNCTAGGDGIFNIWWKEAQYYRITFSQVTPWPTTLIYLNPNLTSSTYIGDSPNYNNPASADTVQSVSFATDGSNNIYVQYGAKTGVGNYVWTKLDFGQPTLPDPSYSPTSAQIHSIEFVMSLLYKKGQSKLDIMHLTAKPTKFGHICIYSIVSEEEANLALTQVPKVDFETVRVANDLYNQSLLYMNDEVDGLVDYRRQLMEIMNHNHFNLPSPIF
jgi:hypothetical protein